MEKVDITWEQLHRDCNLLVKDIRDNKLEVGVVVGLMRGGMIPATIISYALAVPMLSIGVRTYQGNKKTTHTDVYQSAVEAINNMPQHASINALIVDDISDTGETLDSMLELCSPLFNSVFTLTPYIKMGTKHIPHYYAFTYAKQQWVEFPWD